MAQKFTQELVLLFFDAEGQLVNPQNGAIVQGKVANGLGEIPAGNATQDIKIDMNLKLPAVATENICLGW